MGLALVDTETEPEITFDDFYQAYPRRQNRKMAVLAWKRIDPAERPAILRGIEAWKRSEQWLQNGGQFIPLPSTFLNCERWTDEVEIGIKVTPCRWRGCSRPGTKSIGDIEFCETHFHARKRGESPV